MTSYHLSPKGSNDFTYLFNFLWGDHMVFRENRRESFIARDYTHKGGGGGEGAGAIRIYTA